MRNRFNMSVILALLLLALFPQGAYAEDTAQINVTNIVQLDSDDGKSALSIATRNTAGTNQPKFTALAVKYRHPNDRNRFDGSYDVLAVDFTAGDWRKFVSLWQKAQAEPRYADRDSLIGDYFDKADDTRLTVWASSDGNIVFTVAGNPDAHNQPCDTAYFILSSKDFNAFAGAMTKISAYFGN